MTDQDPGQLQNIYDQTNAELVRDYGFDVERVKSSPPFNFDVMCQMRDSGYSSDIGSIAYYLTGLIRLPTEQWFNDLPREGTVDDAYLATLGGAAVFEDIMIANDSEQATVAQLL